MSSPRKSLNKRAQMGSGARDSKFLVEEEKRLTDHRFSQEEKLLQKLQRTSSTGEPHYGALDQVEGDRRRASRTSARTSAARVRVRGRSGPVVEIPTTKEGRGSGRGCIGPSKVDGNGCIFAPAPPPA
jgi:hypothetical protein